MLEFNLFQCSYPVFYNVMKVSYNSKLQYKIMKINLVLFVLYIRSAVIKWKENFRLLF